MSSSDTGPMRCDFCRIARGDDGSIEVICTAKKWIAFFPLNPATPGHTLVIPRVHVANLWEVEPALGCELMAAVIKVGRAITSALKPDGMNLITSAGESAEQTVFHLHMHLVPRWRRDGFGPIWQRKEQRNNVEIADVANRIRQTCANASSITG